jgi:hypothetical protein
LFILVADVRDAVAEVHALGAQQIECRRFDRTPNIRFQPSAASAIVSRRA